MSCYVMQNNQNEADLVSVAKRFFHERNHETALHIMYPSLTLSPITYHVPFNLLAMTRPLG